MMMKLLMIPPILFLTVVGNQVRRMFWMSDNHESLLPVDG
jgi:hypothetical protein